MIKLTRTVSTCGLLQQWARNVAEEGTLLSGAGARAWVQSCNSEKGGTESSRRKVATEMEKVATSKCFLVDLVQIGLDVCSSETAESGQNLSGSGMPVFISSTALEFL